MTLKQIGYFRMVCEKGNISAAAEALFISRSVVSRAIAELEEEFGAQIFTRSRNGVVLTECGQVLAKLFEAFSYSYSAVQERICKIKAQEQALPLRLGLTPTNAYCIYENYLAEFQRRYPDIQLYVEEHSAFEAWKLLLEGSMDAFFTPAPPDLSVFQTMELYQNPIMLGVAEGNDTVLGETVSIGDLLELPLAFFNAPMPIESILNESFEVFGKKPQVVLRTSDQMLLRELTMRGTVYPILPLDMMATWQGVRQVGLDFCQPSVNRLIWSRTLAPGPAMETFLRFMEGQIK